MPWFFRSASSFSWVTTSVCGAATGAGAGGGACCWYCCSSCCDQRFACRRDTRLDTAVAVPATTAVRATPRRSPGMVGPLCTSGSAVDGVEGGDQVVLRDV